MTLESGRPRDIRVFARQCAIDVTEGHFLMPPGIDAESVFAAQLSYILRTGLNPLTRGDVAAFLVLRSWRGPVGGIVILDTGQTDERGCPIHEI